jgi:hypothetical protein
MRAAYASVKAHYPTDDPGRQVDLFRDDLPTATICSSLLPQRR